MPPAVTSLSAGQSKPIPQASPIPLSAMPLVAPSTLLQAHLSSTPPTRASGRQPAQPRSIDLNIGSLTHCNGSSLVKIGHTTIICGVRGETLPVSEIPSYNASETSRAVHTSSPSTHANEYYDPLALYNLVVPNIDLSTGCSPAHAMNTAPLASTQALTQRLYSLLLSTRVLSLADLEIKYTPPADTNHGLDPDDPAYVPNADVEQVKAYWVLYIDMVCISHGGDGVVFDAAWLAMLAALSDTMLPKAWWDGDDGMVLCDTDVSRATTLSINVMPVPLNFGVFQSLSNSDAVSQTWTLVDLDTFEEECCTERGCVVIDASKGAKLFKIEKTGGAALDIDGIDHVIQIARHRGQEWLKVLKSALDASRS